MSLREEKVPESFPKCPICNNLPVVIEVINTKGKTLEWEIMCDQEDHTIKIIRDTKAEVIETWKKAFGKAKLNIK